jgi:APA family basic amino acid/polyamine antiporter
MIVKDLFRKKTISNVLKGAAEGQEHSLHKGLSVVDLTGFGIAAIIGAGIFTTIGKAAADGGPGVIFLFLFTAIACAFAAFAYAEFASMVPVSGSAYTYSYVAFGELIAWIIGWALIMEYAIGNVTVAIGWSEYFTSLLEKINIPAFNIHGIHLPAWMTTDIISARNGFNEATALMNSGKLFENLDESIRHGFNAYVSAPQFFGLPIICNVPALAIVVFITWLVYRGIKESRNASNIMVAVKLSVVVLVIIAGSYFVNTDNWHPFFPNKIAGVLKGVSAVFFAYIGFDAISTTAEECKNPQRDLPRGMMYALIICTVLYVLITLVLTGMISYDQLNVADPLAHVFDKINLHWMASIIAVSAIFAMASVLLVFQLGQPRIWMSMSRDGLLPKQFARVHPKFKTPSFSTIITGAIVGLGTLFLNIDMVTDLCSIGTLFAFVLVCGGVLKLSTDPNRPETRFKTPYINAKLVMPLLLIIGISLSLMYNKESTRSFLKNESKILDAKTLITGLGDNELEKVKAQVMMTDADGMTKSNGDLESYLSSLDESRYEGVVKSMDISESKKFESGWKVFRHKIPTWIFLIITLVLTVLAWQKNLSLIPILGLECCLYMMSELGYKNWMYFLIWLVIGLIIYFGYSYKNSKLNKEILTS